jgi:hypothetical protein
MENEPRASLEQHLHSHFVCETAYLANFADWPLPPEYLGLQKITTTPGEMLHIF